MIEATVTKSFKGTDFRLQGEIADSGFISLAGSNGSGKSTLFAIIGGTLRPDSGAIKVNSRDITRLPIEKRRVVLVTPESYIPNLKLEKHLKFGAKKNTDSDQKFLDSVRTLVPQGLRDRSVGKMSLGTREKVALATAMLARPEVILVDEAFSNLDNREQFVESYRYLANEAKIDVFFSTQVREDAKLADHLYEIDHGITKKIF